MWLITSVRNVQKVTCLSYLLPSFLIPKGPRFSDVNYTLIFLNDLNCYLLFVKGFDSKSIEDSTLSQ